MPDWSPVADKIAFARGGPSLNFQIWVMDADAATRSR